VARIVPRKAHVLHFVMGARFHPFAAILPLGALVALVIISGPACVPQPINPGYISVPPNTKGIAVMGLMGGGAYEMSTEAGYGGGALLFDPFITKRLSLPFGLSGGGTQGAGGGAGRLGLRYRAASFMSLGTGLSGGVYGAFDAMGAVFLDFELAFGSRWSRLGLSLALRPTFDVLNGFFHLPTSLVLAIYPVERFAITLHALGNPFVEMETHPDVGGWIGGGLGIVVHI
jgi:hypothetical protein